MMPKLNIPECLKRFLANQSGTAALVTGIVAIPLMFAAGSAIDFGRLSNAQTHMQVALDTATLAAASLKTKSDVERIEMAQKVFDSNINNSYAGQMSPASSFKIVNGVVVAKAEIEVPSAFMHLAGLDLMKGSTRSEVNILTDKKAEIALVLDYSGSMADEAGGQIKYLAMRDAATNLVNDLQKSDPGKVKWGLVPFSHHVKTTMASSLVLGGSGSTWTGCTQDRQYPDNVSDATPTSDDASKWNQAVAPDHAAWGCDGYDWNNLKTVDLTRNVKSITDQLDIMKPYAWTHIALGVEFGYHMLSPNAPFTNGVAYNDKETKKFMVVLTDGMQTEPGFGPDGTRSVANGENNLAELCTNAKANGITIITLAFDLDDTSTRQRLKDCSSNPATDFMIANSSADLASAFDSVKAAITAEIILKR